MLAEIAFTPELLMAIVAVVGALCTLITTGIAVYKHIKAGNWEAITTELTKATDALKRKIPARKRAPILKGLGVRLGRRKALLDKKLDSLGLDSKS